MELRHLRYFVAVAEELHFGRAAERLFIVQPALSKQISVLEKELGVTLFERSKRHVQITPAGEALLQDARQMLAQAEGAVQRAKQASTGQAGVLRIGFIAPALYELLPRALRAFRAACPDVHLVLEELHNRESLDGVLNRGLHLAVVRLPVPARDGLLVVPVSEEPVVVAMSADNPLALLPEVGLSDLQHENIILIARALEPELYDRYISACLTAGFSPRVAHEVDRTHVAVGLVASGLGVCFVPASAMLMAHPHVAYRPLAAPNPGITLGVVWARGEVPPVLRTFLALRPWEATSPPSLPADGWPGPVPVRLGPAQEQLPRGLPA